MRIETASLENLRNSVCECLNIHYYTLFKELNKLYDMKAEKSGEVFNKEVMKFIGSCNLTMPDEVEFYHLGWRLNGEETSENKNLRELVLSPNSFSEYLEKHDITFSDDGLLKVFYKGDEILKSNDNDAGYLRARLGMDNGYKDCCVNGFAFRDSLKTVPYWNDLRFGPEFLQMLAQYIQNRSLIEDYRKSGKYYCFKYIVPLDAVILDDFQDAANKAKIYQLLDQCFRHLLYYHTNPQFDDFSGDSDNLRLRLKDTATMKKEWLVSKERIVVH